MVFDQQSNERGGQNLREKTYEKKKKTFREIVVILK